MPEAGEITQLLRRLDAGDEAALEQLMPLLYDELRFLARKHLRRERPDHTLNTTALVNEAYLRLVQQRRLGVEDRRGFFGIASSTMRRILVDYARARKRLKRGGDQQPVPLEEAMFLSEREAEEVLVLDEALTRLEAINPRGSQVIQHRFFGGLTLEETAEVMEISVPTVHRAWRAARNWLRKEIKGELDL